MSRQRHLTVTQRFFAGSCNRDLHSGVPQGRLRLPDCAKWECAIRLQALRGTGFLARPGRPRKAVLQKNRTDAYSSFVPTGLQKGARSLLPAINRWASFSRPYGTKAGPEHLSQFAGSALAASWHWHPAR
jgi:hypothetical protein